MTAVLCLGQGTTDELDMSIKQLMQLEVTSVARKQQTLARSAAAVYVITREQIHRSGYRNVPDVLRLAPGLHVAQVGAHTWAITARGFNGTFAGKMLVLVDGRSIYTPHYAGVYWELHDLMVEDIERIEVIRGPGATMWGANAVKGVINIITRSARSTQGGLVSVGGGTAGERLTALRYGGRLGERAWYRAYAKYAKHRSALNSGRQEAGDAWSDGRGGLRVDWEPSARDAVTLLTAASRGSFSETALIPTGIAPFIAEAAGQFKTSTQDLLVRWRHTHRNGTETQVQFYFDGYDRPHPIFGENRKTADVDVQSRSRLGRIHELTWGGGYRSSADRAGTGHLHVQPETFGLDLYTAFAQDEVQFADGMVVLTAGAKVQRNDYAGIAVQPTARLLVEPVSKHVFWGSVSRAVRLPSRLDRDSVVWAATLPGMPETRGLPTRVFLHGSESNTAQPMIAVEAGYRTQVSTRLGLDVTAFRHLYQRLRSMERGQPVFTPAALPYLSLPMTFAGGLHGESWGVEAVAQLQLMPRWNLSANYTGMRASYAARADSPLSFSGESAFQPEHLASLRSQFDLPGRLQLDAAWYAASAVKNPGEMPSIFGYQLPRAWSRMDVRAMWPVRPGLELGCGVNGLVDPRREEFRPEAFLRPAELRRTFDATLDWRF
jgi:iron complex outermembrane receptor protein